MRSPFPAVASGPDPTLRASRACAREAHRPVVFFFVRTRLTHYRAAKTLVTALAERVATAIATLRLSSISNHIPRCSTFGEDTARSRQLLNRISLPVDDFESFVFEDAANLILGVRGPWPGGV